MKNPIEHLKHLWKDPINTIEEADARKKEILPWLYGSIGVAALFSILDGILGTGFLMIFALIGVFGIMAFGFMLFVIGKAKDRFKALTCDGCNTLATIKTPEEFAEFISYTVGKHEATYHGVSHPASNNGVVSKVEAKGSASVVVYIDLKCPNCGKVKKLEYHIVPFKCSQSEEKVLVRDVELVKMRLDAAVKAVVADYNDPEKRKNIPYSIHSVNNPNYENRTKPQFTSSRQKYNGVTIDYRKDVEEMVEQFFLANQLDGNLVDPSKTKK
ncbi:MAG: hypothetical protein E7598_05455 [Ruminococcaceae bacterium]|nr:hypothetical protein [Oscillospiraceae bacterium]